MAEEESAYEVLFQTSSKPQVPPKPRFLLSKNGSPLPDLDPSPPHFPSRAPPTPPAPRRGSESMLGPPPVAPRRKLSTPCNPTEIIPRVPSLTITETEEEPPVEPSAPCPPPSPPSRSPTPPPHNGEEDDCEAPAQDEPPPLPPYPAPYQAGLVCDEYEAPIVTPTLSFLTLPVADSDEDNYEPMLGNRQTYLELESDENGFRPLPPLPSFPPLPPGSLAAPPMLIPPPGATENLQKFDWFLDIERDDAAKGLYMFKKEGSYLVRKGKRGGKENPFSLSLFHSHKVFHLNIRKRAEDQFYSLGKSKPKEKAFESVPELVEYHQREPILLTSNGNPEGSTALTFPLPSSYVAQHYYTTA